MKCPKCEVVELTMADRVGVEIDYCSSCRGVWLDRGELDKIIDRAAVPANSSERHSPPTPAFERERERYDEDDDDEHRGRRKKRGGFLGELFDF